MKKISLWFTSFGAAFLWQAVAFAQEAEGAGGDSGVGMAAAIGAGLAIGIAAVGCGLGQGRAGAAALEGIARNPNAYNRIFTPMIISLALIESLAIYALVIAFMLYGKIPG